MATALIITATPQPALAEALRAAGCTDLDTLALDEATALLRHERTVDLVVVEIVDSTQLDALTALVDTLRGAALLALVPEHLIDAVFDLGATEVVVTPLRRGELIARVRAAVCSGHPQHRSRRERRLTDELLELQRQKQDLERIACVDSLTGVANRRHALRLLEAEWKRSARDGTPLSIVMIDLDCFHAFNERYGHIGGDRCLRKVSDTMVRCLRRPSDYLGRYGGEEFIAVLANTDAEGARIVAERLRGAVEALGIPHEASQCSDVVTMSVGHATCRATLADSMDVVISAADRALLAAKSTGRNRVIGDAPTPHRRARSASTPWRRFPPVVADPWFADRIPPFLAETRDELPRLREAVDAGAFDQIRALARRLRVAAGEHSIETMAELAGMLERAARGCDAESTRRIVDELDSYVAHVQVTYRRPLERELELEQAG